MRTLLMTLGVLGACCAPAWADEGMPRQGFVFNLRIGGGVPVSLSGAAISPTFNALPAIAIGGRLIDRLELTMGFNFAHVGTTGMGTDLSAFMFVPTLACDFVRASDRKVALYGKFGLPLGAVVPSGAPPGTNPTNTFVVGFDLALGVRYAFHRMFALGFEGGAATLFVDADGPNTAAIAVFYALFSGTFYYGS